MKNELKLKEVEDSIIILRGQKVILDVDVAHIYGVETKRINEAVKNNPDKFPQGYIFDITKEEFEDLRSKFSTANKEILKSKNSTLETEGITISPKSRVLPKAFTEKGLYMLATILHSPKATETTIAIVETFSKVRELARTVSELSKIKDDFAQKRLMEKGGDLISELLDPDMEVSEDETEIELNFAVLKLKRTIKRKKK
jgi:hypothetical protein